MALEEVVINSSKTLLRLVYSDFEFRFAGQLSLAFEFRFERQLCR